MIALTDAERERFIAYLRQEAVTADGLAKQMAGAGMPDAAVKRYRLEAAAYALAANNLASWERQEVQG